MSIIRNYCKSNSLAKGILLSIYWLFSDYFFNHIVYHIPFWYIRKIFYIIGGAHFGKKTQMDMKVTVMGLGGLKVGNHCHINRDCLIDARGKIIMHDNVSISHRVVIMTGSHNHKSSDFEFIATSIEIDDYVWVGVNATIVGDVHIGRGAVVCAGSVVTKNVEPYAIVAGIPAKKIGERPHNLEYVILDNIYPFPTFA